MSYVTGYLLNATKEDIIKNLQDRNKKAQINVVKKANIGNFLISNQKNGYIHGKIAVERLYEDYSFDLSDDFEIETKNKELYIYDEVDFTIFPDIKVITFGCKDKAKLFGMEILSKLIFNDGGKIYGLVFYPQKVLLAKKKGQFENVWFNGVKFSGKIQYTGQFGNEIDEDDDFLDNPENRMGLGIVFHSMSGKKIKIAVYKDGTVLRHAKLRDYRDEMKLEKEITTKFLPYSNYSTDLPKKAADEFTSLNDWLH